MWSSMSGTFFSARSSTRRFFDWSDIVAPIGLDTFGITSTAFTSCA